MAINYFSQDIDFILKGKCDTRRWIAKVIHLFHFKAGDINYIFVSNNYILEINKKFLGHDYFTDIITFDNSEKKDIISGDIYISIETVKSNAEKYDVTFDNELKRVMIHGILHLIGFNDHTDEEKVVMREKEESCLKLLFS